MSDSSAQFDSAFEALTGNKPLSWQTRLFDEFKKPIDQWPAVIDLPTGLGKTMVMAVWLIAREHFGRRIPTRLIYVVDRRTVVDQATDLAQKLRDNCKQALGIEPPAVSTLRGQLADKREWSRDPSRPAIIIGTVDLIGSALLFSAYRSSFKRRPLEAGLLGQDSLLVLDEAHLSRPFDKLLRAIEQFNKPCGTGVSPVQPMRVIRMSATSTAANDDAFRLEGDHDARTGDFADETIRERFSATKRLTVAPPVEKSKLSASLALAAVDLAKDHSRVVVFVRSPDDATAIAEILRKHQSSKNGSRPFEKCVAVLTGTMRGLERDEMLEEPAEGSDAPIDQVRRVMRRFLSPDNRPAEGPAILISTSAGEVGFDLNADHLVGDAAPLDSWIQRLGRVNRRGGKDKTAVVRIFAEKNAKEEKPIDKACVNAIRLLSELEHIDTETQNNVELAVYSASPSAIKAFKEKESVKAKLSEASMPEPTSVELTDILLDAWSMTSITEPMPGRPEVAPWLRGIDEELPQTTIAWRAELDQQGVADLDLEDIEEWFDTHRILTHETLSVPTSVAAKWFADRWDKLDDHQKAEVGKRSIVVDRAGLALVTVTDVINQLARKNTDSIRNADLIIPASFGGIERGIGLLDADAPTKPLDEKNADEQTRQSNAQVRLIAPDVADVRRRYREKMEKPEDGEAVSTPLIPGSLKPQGKCSRFILELESNDDKTVRLVSHVPRLEKPETGQRPQTLKQHVCAVRKSVDDILSRLSLPEDIKLAAQHAADWHDNGKARERWQRLLVFPRKDFIKPDEPMGKSGGEMKRDSRGYRHEFGSLREFTDSMNGKISGGVSDLVMHLIATHHGRGRPHFPKGGFDPDCESRSDETHTESIRRFARLQRKYGWWRLAWLENLLRCADAMASADQDAEDDAADAEGAEQ